MTPRAAGGAGVGGVGMRSRVLQKLIHEDECLMTKVFYESRRVSWEGDLKGKYRKGSEK